MKQQLQHQCSIRASTVSAGIREHVFSGHVTSCEISNVILILTKKVCSYPIISKCHSVAVSFTQLSCPHVASFFYITSQVFLI